MIFNHQSVPILPLFRLIDYTSPRDMFELFANAPWNMLIESANSALQVYGTNRYSYILVDPFERYVYQSGASALIDPILDLQQLVSQYKCMTIKNIPPFQGGIAGYCSYDLAHVYQPVPRPIIRDMDCPDLCMGFYDLICSFDHVEKKTYIISSGFPEKDEKKRMVRAKRRLHWFLKQLEQRQYRKNAGNKPLVSASIQSNFTKENYTCAVNKVIEYIRDGDVFQVNLSQRFETNLPHDFNHYALYKNLCLINPAPFAAFLNLGPHKIISASPERYLFVHNRRVETRPIKGTRARSADKQEDDANIVALLESTKDRAENTMIVDLMRNDLSIVCEDDSIQVDQLCGHERYPTVHHLVSIVSGTLREEHDVFCLLKATFPGGSITGAPKIRAMQIIAELEPHQRGPYCGSIVLIGFNGSMDSSIVIRTYVINRNVLTFHAGGAVVMDSSPLDEYEETLTKSRALRAALCEGSS